MIKAVIFDLDGTLLNTIEDIHSVVCKVLRRNGLPERTLDEVKAAVGKGVDVLARRILYSEKLDEKTFLKITDDIRSTFLDEGIVHTKPYEGITGMLENLVHEGIQLAVLTNKPQASAEAAVTGFFPDVRFRTVNGAMNGLPMKPAPESILSVLEILGTLPGETLMVGDSDVDMDTAKNAGLIAVGVSWGFRNIELLLDHGADVIVHTPAEIIELVFRSHNSTNR